MEKTCNNCKYTSCPKRGSGACRNYKPATLTQSLIPVLPYLKEQGFSFITVQSVSGIDGDNRYDKTIISNIHLVAYRYTTLGKVQYYARPGTPRFGDVGRSIPLDISRLEELGYDVSPFHVTDTKVSGEYLRY